MQGDFSELSRHFDDKFEELKRRLFDLENKFSNTERKIDDLQRNKYTLDDHTKKADAAFQEIARISQKVDDCARQLNQLSGRIK
jgi:chromosome segregation ATPase